MECKWNAIFDIYSPGYKLKFKGKESYNSTFGKIMGLCSITIFISLFINFEVELFSRKNFDILYSSVLNNDFQINLTNIPFFLMIMDKHSNIISYNESIFKFSFQYNKQIFKNKLEPEDISMKYNLEKCDSSLFAKEDLDLLNNYGATNLSSFICFPRDVELVLYGRIGHNYSSILLILSICDENNTNCENFEKIENMLNEGYIIMSYLSYSIDHYSYDHPIKKSFKTDIFSIPNKNLIKTYNYYFDGAKYENDNGLLFKKINKIDFFEPNGITFDINLINNTSNNKDNNLISIQLECSPFYNIYHREYKKIQYYLGLFNGCCQGIYIIFKFISNFILLKMSSRDIVNEIFFKETLNKTNENVQLKSNNNLKINSGYLSQKHLIEIENKKSSNSNLFPFQQKSLNDNIKQNSINTYVKLNLSFYNKYFKSIIFDMKHYFIPNICLKNDKKFKILNELYQNINSKISIEVLYFNKINKNKEKVLNEVFSNKIFNYI